MYEMIIKQEMWDECVKSNKDPYGRCCVDVARKVMEIIDEENPETLDCHKLICRADDEINAGGITGFMAGCVANMVAKFHSRGEEFRKAWNKPYLKDGQEDKGGVVNPAIITIG